jgi:hypothetical protein
MRLCNRRRVIDFPYFRASNGSTTRQYGFVKLMNGVDRSSTKGCDDEVNYSKNPSLTHGMYAASSGFKGCRCAPLELCDSFNNQPTTNVFEVVASSFNADFQECEYTGRRARRALEGIR